MSNRLPLNTDQRRALWAPHHPAFGVAKGLPPRRRPARLAYDGATVAVRISHPGGGHRTAAVYAHDLSAGGVSFLYPGFLHAGTIVSTALHRRGGGQAVAHGSVAWCRHVGGLWHGVGVGFVVPLDPADFVDPDPVAGEPTTDTWVEVKPHATPGAAGLAGRVLYLEDQELDQGLFLHTLRRTRLKVTAVGTAAAAVAAVAAGEFDVVAVDLNLGPTQPTGERAMAELRAAGFDGPFVVLTDEAGPRLDRAVEIAGGGTLDPQVVPKPYTAAVLIAALTALLPSAKKETTPMSAAAVALEDAPPLHSQMAGQDGMAPLLRGFCDRAQAAAADLDRLLAPSMAADGRTVIDNRATVGVRQVCQMLRGAGRGYGYPALSAAADAALRVLEEGLAGPASAAAELRALQALCRRVVA